jgi:hypothetical protein
LLIGSSAQPNHREADLTVPERKYGMGRDGENCPSN